MGTTVLHRCNLFCFQCSLLLSAANLHHLKNRPKKDAQSLAWFPNVCVSCHLQCPRFNEVSAQHQVHPRPTETQPAAGGQSGYPRKPQIILNINVWAIGINK